MRRGIGGGVAMTAIAATAACAFVEDPSFGPCPTLDVIAMGGVDWAQASVVDVRIRQDEFSPMVIGLERNRPYVLRFSNGDDSPHTFYAPQFFATAAVDRVRVGDAEQPQRCSASVRVGPGDTTEVWLVALADGRYPFRDPSLWDWWSPPITSFGAVYVR